MFLLVSGQHPRKHLPTGQLPPGTTATEENAITHHIRATKFTLHHWFLTWGKFRFSRG